MKKTKYIYKHTIYGGGPNGFNDGEVGAFFAESGVKLHASKKDDYFYSWEFAGDHCSWFTFSHSEEVEIEEKVTKLPTENRYENGYNWKAKGPNARLRKANPKADPYWSINKGKSPINPKTGRRDGGV
jgi:hypothetical protein